MQNLTDQAEASISTETAINGPNLNRTFTVRRKAAKRSERWYQHNIPARKKPRLDEHLPTTADEADRETASPDDLAGLPPPTTDSDDANVDHVTDTQPNARATEATGRWTPEEDAKLTSAIAKTKKKWWGKEYKIDWIAIAALVPGRTEKQCDRRWKDALDPKITLTAVRKGSWTEDEDLLLKKSVQMHGGKDWAAIAALVSGRTKTQCFNRWYNTVDPSIALTAGRTGKWTEDEDLRLKNSVELHGGKDWAAIAALVPGRTQKQCRNRWYNTVDPSIALTAGRMGTWTEDEDVKLKHSVQMHGGKDWAAIAALVAGRTKAQCFNRWNHVLDPSSALTGKWGEDEDLKLKNAVQMHGGKDWPAITALVPGRSRSQCRYRWVQMEETFVAQSHKLRKYM